MFGPFLLVIGKALAEKILTSDVAVKYVKLGIDAVVAGIEGEPKLRALTSHVKLMVSEQREPTDAEFNQLAVQDAAADARIEAEAARRGL